LHIPQTPLTLKDVVTSSLVFLGTNANENIIKKTKTIHLDFI
jgi:hypothetical protein